MTSWGTRPTNSSSGRGRSDILRRPSTIFFASLLYEVFDTGEGRGLDGMDVIHGLTKAPGSWRGRTYWSPVAYPAPS